MAVLEVFISALLLVMKVGGQSGTGYYTAAVYEHARYQETPEDPTTEIIAKNLEAYVNATSVAANKAYHNGDVPKNAFIKGADIIVFPEYGLYSFTKNRTIFKEYGEFVPDPKETRWNPCLSTMECEDLSITRTLSCLAKRHNLYIVANMIATEPCNSSDPDCPSDNVYVYNTNVVFDREGNLVARYRKYHLCFEPSVDPPKEFEYTTFTTEFGTIGTFICFDIMWKPSAELLKKYDIDAVAFPTMWHDGLPMYSSMQTMWSWSVGNNMKLLGANVQHSSKARVGSGIFMGSSKAAHYVYNPDGKSRLILSKVPTPDSQNAITPPTVIEFEHSWTDTTTYNNLSSGQCSLKILGEPKNAHDYRCNDMGTTNFTLVKLQKDGNTARGCNNNLCCEVNYDVDDMDEDYYLAVRNSTLDMSPNYRIWEENCLVIRCDEFNGTECSTFPTKSSTVFKYLTISSNMTSTHVYPSVLTSGIRLLPPEKWSYTLTSLSLQTDDGLLFAVLNGRSYERDPPYIP